MGQVVYGGCIEPGGMELDDDKYECECPACGGVAIRRDWDSVEGGSINPYWSLSCTVCPHYDGDLPDSMDDDFDSFRTAENEADYWAEMQSYADDCEDMPPVWMQTPDYLALAQGVRRTA